MIGFKVKEFLKDRHFTFTEVMNMDDFQESIVDNLIKGLTKEQKMDIIWEVDHKGSGMTFNKLVDIYVKAEVTKITKEVFLEYLENASISFNEDVETISPVEVPVEGVDLDNKDEDIEQVVEELTPLEEKTKTIKELVKANREPMSVDEMKKEGII